MSGRTSVVPGLLPDDLPAAQRPAGTVPPDLVEERRAVYARMLAAGRAPGGRLVVVGEPGLGKSRLVDAVVRTLHDERHVLFLRGDPAPTPDHAALGALVADLPSPAAVRVRRALATAHGPAGRPGLSAALERDVAEVLAGLAPGVTLVVDEWQWLDEASIGVLQRVLGGTALGDVVSVVLAGRRPTTGGARGFFRPDQVVRLEPLGPASIAAVLDRAGLGALPAATVAAVTQDSGGNPLWALALASARVTGDPRSASAASAASPTLGPLVTTRAPEPAPEVPPSRPHAGPDPLPDPLPSTPRDALPDPLPATLRAVLATVALMGGARLDELVRVVPGAEGAACDGLGRGLLRLDDEVLTATDPDVARRAVDALDPVARRALHRAVAALPLPRTQRVEHLDLAAPPGPDEELAADLVLAARRARRTETSAVALRLARRALQRTPEESGRFAERAVEAAEDALASGDAALVPELLRPLDASALSVAVFDRAACVLAESTARTGGLAAVARFFAAVQRSLVPGSPQQRVAEAHRRLALPGTDLEGLAASLPSPLGPDGAPHTSARVLTAQARARLDAGGGVDDARLDRVRDLDAGTGPLETSADALAAGWAYQADDLARSRAGLAGAVRAATRAGEPYAAVDALAHAAAVEVLAGRPGTAEALLAEAAERSVALETLPTALHRARGLLAVARHDRAARDHVLAGPLDPEAPAEAELLRAAISGLDDAASGAWAEAASTLRRARAAAEAQGIAEPGRRLWIDVELVRALIQLGRLSEAGEVVDAVAAVGSRPGRVHARGQGRRLRALLAWRSGDLPTALRLSERALGDLEAGGHRPQLVRAQLERVSMLEEDGRVPQARALLTRATALAEDVGDPRLLAGARRLAPSVAAGALPVAGRDALTPSELRVARAVAGGASNRAIATDLVVSVRTVETHLANAYRKLGVHSRTQLALSLNDLPLVSTAPSRQSP
ncbi:helix-turn-helix domain-containing protein [Microlunatus flavus]|uniref:AAA ATPase domain-containing protein n=1 Tax=Microlunatus flavus TaxID=1036181 RepID=A0A1H9C0P8_9ACTN|nr:helix-turn-helix transcriptional regulator [Microlunatus flavus]SEP94363.1 AAA ATPase domain-containing protein [Microlunatus flavus]